MPALRIKICGITREADGLQAALLGADAIGLNFYASSPRWIDAATARAVCRALPPFVDPVGLFVNKPLAEVFEEANQLGCLRTLQWHGEQREVCDAFPF